MSDTATLRTYQAKCHCGKFAFEFDHKPIEEGEVVRCNCSICHNRGYLFVYPKIDQLRFTKGSLKEMTQYWFGGKTNPHYFCPVCGSGPLEDGEASRHNQFGVNIRCVTEGIDWSKLTYLDLDGASD